MASRWSLIACCLLALAVSCRPPAPHEAALAVAFIGPATVNLHRDIDPKSPVSATAHFGEKVEIVGTRRRFVKVRTPAGAEGWIADHMLLAQAEMDEIRKQTEAARAYPSQGVAKAEQTMNVHVQPDRRSPSYLQFKEGDKFDVLEHRLVAVPISAMRKNLVPTPAKPPRKPRKESKSKVPPPPSPAPPALPSDWLDLSKEGEDAVPPKNDEPPPTTRLEDWSLVRASSGQSGWVRSSVLYMAIPDEVAQYAEGKRITSYFTLGQVHDGDKVKDIWLWTTIASPNQPFDFDGFRVFIWSLRHHRYETALIQRRLTGYFPTLVDSKAGTFGVCIEKDGRRYRREYQLVENIVKYVGEKPCDAGKGQGNTPLTSAPQPAPEGAFEKLKGKLKSIMK